MNKRILELSKQAGLQPYYDAQEGQIEKFAELIVKECVDICMEMSAKCAGLPGDGALAKDCAYWIKKDLGVKE